MERAHAVPPKVEYSLTEYGGSLKRALQAICDWGRIHMERTHAAERAPQLLLKGMPKKKSREAKGPAVAS